MDNLRRSNMMKYSNIELRRYSRQATVILFMAGLAILFFAVCAHANDDPVRVLIQKAGNADSDEARLDYLKQIRKQTDLEESFKSDLDKLIAQIDRWLNEKRLDYFGGQVRRNRDFDFKIAEDGDR